MVPKADWQQIYLAYKFLIFYAFSLNSGLIEGVRDEYARFSKENFPLDNDKNSLDSIPNLDAYVCLIVCTWAFFY